MHPNNDANEKADLKPAQLIVLRVAQLVSIICAAVGLYGVYRMLILNSDDGRSILVVTIAVGIGVGIVSYLVLLLMNKRAKRQ